MSLLQLAQYCFVVTLIAPTFKLLTEVQYSIRQFASQNHVIPEINARAQTHPSNQPHTS